MSPLSKNTLKRNAAVEIGPEEIFYGHPAHFVRHRTLARFYRLGVREAYVLTLLDGTRALPEIASFYARRFGTGISESRLQRMIEIFRQSNLIDGDEPAHLRATPIRQPKAFLTKKVTSFDADTILALLLRRCSWIFIRPTVIILFLWVFAGEIWLIFHGGELIRVAAMNTSYAVTASVILGLLLFLSTSIFHEGMHALTCKHFGGDVLEVGIISRYLMFYPYVNLDSIAFFHNRYNRVWVLAAGPLASLFFVPLIEGAFLLTRGHTLERSVIATILVWYNAAALTNFLPVLEMDGYFILAHLCRMPNLRADAYEHVKRRLLRLVRGRGDGLAQFSLSASILLLAYAVVSFVASVSMVLLLPYSAYYRKMPIWETSALALTLFVVYFGSTARKLMFRGAETKA